MNTIYLLTGAAGLLGSNISRQLIETGHTVRALVLKNDPKISEADHFLSADSLVGYYTVTLESRKTKRLAA